jgi:hypothetical protein
MKRVQLRCEDSLNLVRIWQVTFLCWINRFTNLKKKLKWARNKHLRYIRLHAPYLKLAVICLCINFLYFDKKRKMLSVLYFPQQPFLIAALHIRFSSCSCSGISALYSVAAIMLHNTDLWANCCNKWWQKNSWYLIFIKRKIVKSRYGYRKIKIKCQTRCIRYIFNFSLLSYCYIHCYLICYWI